MIHKPAMIRGGLIAAAFAAVLCSSACASRAGMAASGADSSGRIRPVPVSGLAPEPVTLESVRRRWNGNRCQIRFPAKIKKGKGWVNGDWMLAPALPGDKDLYVRLSVSDRNRLEQAGFLSGGKDIRAGTYFIAEDWRLKDPDKGRGMFLDLRFEELPVQARLEFRGGVRLSDIERIEQVARIELFQLHGPPEAAPGNPAPQFRIASATVNPTVARPGEEIELLVTYSVPLAGDVKELREIHLDGRMIAGFPLQRQRQAGSYTSSHKVTIKAGTAPGMYTYRVQVDLTAGNQRQTSEATASFEVREN